MMRIWTLSRYFLRTFFKSITGLIFLLLTLGFWFVLYSPQQVTPDASYYILGIGVFGAGMGFLLTLAMAAQANKMQLAAWLPRIPSRAEYLTAVFLSTLIATSILQLLLALLALINGPKLSFANLMQIPPVWGSMMLVTAVLALHATDLVTNGWSRVYVFGILAILLFGQGINNSSLSRLATNLSEMANGQGWYDLSQTFNEYARTVATNDSNILSQLFGFVFWPFTALADGIVNGQFSTAQALAPAILLLYAVILFMLAADFFAGKDLHLME